MSFNDAAITEIFDAIVSYAITTGRFDHVNQHEVKSAPGSAMSCSVWVQSVRPVRSSGLAATSGVVLINARIYRNMRRMPYDMIDPDVTAAVADLMGTLSGDFNFGGIADIRNLDLLGSTGAGLSAQAGYIEIDRQMFRSMTLAIPIIINDMFVQEV